MPVPCDAEMTLGTLCVQVSATKQVSVRYLQQQYGDGYVARRQDGVNPLMETWRVATPPMPVANALALEEELIALGSGFFEWTAPNDTEAKNWVLEPVQWDWSYQTGDIASLSFTLKRWYN